MNIAAVQPRIRFIPAMGIVVALVLLVPSDKSAVAKDAYAGGSAEVEIAVLGLFHPQVFEVTPVDGQALVLRTDRERAMLQESSGAGPAIVRISGDGVAVSGAARIERAPSAVFTGRKDEAADFILAIPGKISRRYHGTLGIRLSAGHLLAILTLDREAAVAAIVAAETDSDFPLEALKAQAIATRSYLDSARGRHREFDFCDTTHCQFMRGAPASGSAVARAVLGTRGMVLAYNAQPFPAMYTRSCAGQTRTPAQVGLTNAAYPYYPVDCAYCRRHPQRWTRRIPAEDVSALHNLNESSRLEIDRRLGWSAIPSNDFAIRKEGGDIVLSGEGNGHGIGLCQAGAKAMAVQGANFREILDHYYPNTTVMMRVNAQEVERN
jgi:stage II sporulation protein D